MQNQFILISYNASW